MSHTDHPDTRYFVEVDLRSQKIIRIASGNRFKLFHAKLDSPDYHRIFISNGQFN